MKTTIQVIMTLFLLILFNQCNKEPANPNPQPEPPEINCYEKVFLDTVPAPVTPISIADFKEDNNFNIIYAGLFTEYGSANSIWLAKLDTNLSELWTYTFFSDEELIQAVEYDSENNYYLVTRKGWCEIDSTGFLAQDVFWQSYYINYEYCRKRYYLSSDTLKYASDHSETIIYKLDTDGNLLWRNEYKYGAGHRDKIKILENDNIIIARTKTYCRDSWVPVYHDGVFQDTINLPDETFVQLTKLNQSGDILWERELTIPTLSFDQWYTHETEINVNIAYSSGHIFLTAFNTIFKLDTDGNILEKFETDQSYCLNFILKNSPANNGIIYYVRRHNNYDQYPNVDFFLGKYFNGSTEWETEFQEIPQYHDYSNLLSAEDGNFYFSNDYYISKYDENGHLLWKLDYAPHILKVVHKNCMDGLLMLCTNSLDYPGKIVIIRTDKNGHYE